MSNFHVFVYMVPILPDSGEYPFGGMNDYYASYSNLSDAIRAAEDNISSEYIYERETRESTIAVEMGGKLVEVLYSCFQPFNVQEWRTTIDNERLQDFVYEVNRRGRFEYKDYK